MSISKAQWQAIETALMRLGGCAEFALDGHKITTQKRMVSENRMAIMVYIDGQIKGKWVIPGEKDAPAIVPKVWRLKTKAYYGPAKIKRLEKQFGKRKAREYFPKLHEKQHGYLPDFSTAKSLVRQYKKIEGLTLTSDLHTGDAQPSTLQE